MHHGPNPDQEITRELESLREGDAEELGATGRFPGGRLVDSDEGEIRFAIGYKTGKVIIAFGQPIAWMGMSTEQAKDLARDLMSVANPITRPRTLAGLEGDDE